jgi:hypothetical protein
MMAVTSMNKTRLRALRDQLAAIDKELKTLAKFRQTAQVKRFKRQLLGEYSNVKRQIARLQEPSRLRSPSSQRQANEHRRQKMKRSWRYFAAIKENYAPEMSTKEIRSLFTKRRKGMQVDVSDVAWANPSP